MVWVRRDRAVSCMHAEGEEVHMEAMTRVKSGVGEERSCSE